MFVRSFPPPFSEAAARAAIAASTCWADALRKLGYEAKGANYRTLQRWAKRWEISTDHFDPHVGRRRAGVSRRFPLEQVLVENSTYTRGTLKTRLLSTGLKRAICELCGQGEKWKGKQMSMVLDHINGISNDHRLENLRIVCPNCAATLDTHCGRNLPRERICGGCGDSFVPTHIRHRYCSQDCWGKVAADLYRGTAHPETRKVERPSYDQLKADLAVMSFVAVGRQYGVTDNAVRKWLRWYERQEQREGAGPGTSDEQAA
ncbi:MAG TPA: hypothetical protein VMD09_06040 [Solirubrobacteraceae bacterium]|nr:hypothetical protein [Solirubrobacteraceae bacterium]